MRWSSAALVTVLTLSSVASAEEEAESRKTVEQLNAGLLQAMAGGDALGYAGRSALLEPIIDRTFDLPFIAELSLGRHRHALSEEAAAEWLALFRRFTISVYAERFRGNAARGFEIQSVEPARRDTYVVRNRLLRSGGRDPVQIDYRLRRSPDRVWKIIDVYLNGVVSELALRRSEYSAVVERDGFDALVKSLEETVAAAAGTQ